MARLPFNWLWASNPAPDQFEEPPQSTQQSGWVGGAQGQLPEARWENYWHHRVDAALQQLERDGAMEWLASVPYEVGAVVRHGGINWIAPIASEGIEPQSAQDQGHWQALGVASSVRLDEPIDQAPDAETVQEALAALGVSLTDQVWAGRAIGEEIWLDDSNPAVQVPPTDNSNFRFVKLTAGENGSGDYNEGILINETVSGSAPLIEATAEVHLPGSPFHGQTVRLLNTERRMFRAGEAATVQDDAIQNITGSFTLREVAFASGSGRITVGSTGGGFSQENTPGTASTVAPQEPDRTGQFTTVRIDASRIARTGNETRPRNIGRSIYMRIL